MSDALQKPVVEIVDSRERTWAMLCHLLALAGWIIPVLGAILGPLVIWLLKKDQYPVVDVNGKESLNFQITVILYSLVAFLLCFLLIGFMLLVIIGVADLVLVIIAAIKAHQGENYRYPFTLRLIK